ncbi:uncharacterized protein [Haliotis asinina]|uniref:uncharacterized protein n=1 Tax=Haliotis asinina TaxID=109174 RepID=UPI003531B124
MKKLHGGYELMIDGKSELFYGTLLCVVGDTPAAQMLGGFKEGVGFAEKPCRTCEISRDDLTYSKTIHSLLDNGRIMEEWFKFIEETAYHLLSYYFNHVLSQKVRNIRWARKRRSDRISSETGGKKKKTHLSLAKIDEVKEMDMEEAKKILEFELQKPKEQQDKALIMKAQRATFKERRHFVENVQEDGNIQVIVKAHPLLKIEDYTEDDPHDPVDTNEAILDLFMTTHHEIKYTPKKSKKTLPSTISKVDVKNADLSTRRKEAPRLIVVTTQGKIGSCFVVADGFELNVSKDIKEAVLSLVMSYYRDEPACWEDIMKGRVFSTPAPHPPWSVNKDGVK